MLVVQGAAAFELLPCEDETLPVRRDLLLVLNSGLDIVDGVRGLDFESDGVSGESRNEDLHGLSQRWWLLIESERGRCARWGLNNWLRDMSGDGGYGGGVGGYIGLMMVREQKLQSVVAFSSVAVATEVGCWAVARTSAGL